MAQRYTIPEELFVLLCRKYILGEDGHDARIQRLVEDKYESWSRRETYTRYKKAATEQEREEARRQYLDQAGIGEDWRW